MAAAMSKIGLALLSDSVTDAIRENRGSQHGQRPWSYLDDVVVALGIHHRQVDADHHEADQAQAQPTAGSGFSTRSPRPKSTYRPECGQSAEFRGLGDKQTDFLSHPARIFICRAGLTEVLVTGRLYVGDMEGE